MSEARFWRELERCRLLAGELDNLVLAEERARELEAAAADAEQRYHLGQLEGWIARRLEQRRGDTGGALGQVELMLVDTDRSGQAFLARVEAAPRAEAGLTGASPRFRAALERAERCAMSLLLSHGELPASAPALRQGVRLAGPPALEALALDGDSAAAAAALALVSAWSGVPVPTGVVVTGALGPDGGMLPVERVPEKVACARRERGPDTRIIVPEGSALDGTEEAASLAELVAMTLGELPASGAPLDIQAAVSQGVWLYEKEGRFSLVATLLGHALASIRLRRSLGEDPLRHRGEEVTCLWRRGSCLTHLGEEARALESLRQARTLAEPLWQEGEISPGDYLGLAGSLAVLLRDTLRYPEAEALLLDTLEQQRALRQEGRVRARTMGNLGELWTFMGRYAEAEQILEQALEILGTAYPDEAPRELCYLGNCALAAGAPARALERYGQGLELNAAVEHGREQNEAFLRHGQARALRALGRPDEAISEADRVLAISPAGLAYPRQLSLMVRGLCLIDQGRITAGRQDLGAAADPRHASGAFLRFGLATALGHLALHLLEAGQAEPARQAAHDYIKQSAPYLDAHYDPGWSSEMSARDDLQTWLPEAMALFPY